MNEAINQAIGAADPAQAPPQKKRRVEVPENGAGATQETKQEAGLFSMFSSNSSDGLRKDLKRMLIKNPNLDFQQHHELDEYIQSLDDEQLKTILDTVRFQLGMQNPNGNGISFLGIIGDLSDRFFGTKGLSRKLIDDVELVEMMESLVPSDLTWLSQPFRVINRILYHIQFNS